MRYKDWDEFTKRYPKESAWVLENRRAIPFAEEMFELISSKKDVSPRQRKAMRRAATEGGAPEDGAVPSVGDTVSNETVTVFSAYTDRGDIRYTFRHPDGYAGRWERENVVTVTGRACLCECATAAGHAPSLPKPPSSGAALNFVVKVISARVVWRRKDFVILEEVEVDRIALVAETKKVGRLTTLRAGEGMTGEWDAALDDRASAACGAEKSNPTGKTISPEPEPPEEIVFHTTDRGVPLPDFADWKGQLR